MKKVFQVLLTGLMVFSLPASSFAGEIDILIDKLVEKGILTPLEAQIIADETKATVAKQNAQGKNDSLPKWVQKMKLKGDIRLRYQLQDDENDNNRDRARVRFRLGLETKVNNRLKVGAGFATGGEDPRSTNQSFDETFSTKGIQLDYAYAEYQATGWAKFIGGKFKRKNYLWNTTDLLWDGDINPEGFAVNAVASAGAADIFANAGYLFLEENSGDADPTMFYTQAGFKTKMDAVDFKVAGTYYGFDKVQGNNLKWCRATNTGLTGSNSSTGACTGTLTHDYDSVSASAEVGVNLEGPIKRIAAFGDYINNSDPDDDNSGYAVGFKFGDKKVKKPGNWQAKYIYAKLERDAWIDAFPDSDRFGGRTDVKSHEVVFKYALAKNVILGIDYYDSERISNASDEEQVLQLDVNIKF